MNLYGMILEQWVLKCRLFIDIDAINHVSIFTLKEKRKEKQTKIISIQIK